jgi:hypothetical protein
VHQRQKLRWNRRSALIAIAAIIVALGLGTYSIVKWQKSVTNSITQDHATDTSTPSASKNPTNMITDPADLVVGTYYGDVISDSKECLDVSRYASARVFLNGFHLYYLDGDENVAGVASLIRNIRWCS